jgi:uncharacterized YccA/Bax inhibitor family protein
MRSSNPVLNRTFRNDLENTSGRPMTLEGSINKTTITMGTVIVAAALSWFTGIGAALWLPAMFIGLGIGLWQSFTKKINPGAIVTYAAVQGVFIGGISSLLESLYPGVVQNAVLATLTTAGGMLAAYKFGWIRVTNRFRQIMTIALFGYLGFALVNLGFAMFAGLSAYNTGFGWAIALLGVGLAALTLSLDFDFIELGVQEGLPEEFEWRAAFGLSASLVWLYVEILRLLSIFSRD